MPTSGAFSKHPMGHILRHRFIGRSEVECGRCHLKNYNWCFCAHMANPWACFRSCPFGQTPLCLATETEDAETSQKTIDNMFGGRGSFVVGVAIAPIPMMANQLESIRLRNCRALFMGELSSQFVISLPIFSFRELVQHLLCSSEWTKIQ